MPKKRTTISHLKLSGSYRPSRHNDREEELDNDLMVAPDKPVFITGEASAEWDRIVPHLLDRGSLSILDLAPLTQYCLHWGRLADHAISGDIEPLPVTFENSLRVLSNELGLSPASRSKVHIVKPKTKSGSIFDGGNM